MQLYDANHLEQTLKNVDEEAFFELEPKTKLKMVIVGGGAFMLMHLTDRQMTRDIDMIEFSTSIETIIKRHPEFNSAAFAFERFLPDGWDSRLLKLDIDTEAIDFFVPCLEDLTVMKLYRNEDNDIEDLRSPKALEKLNWNLLDQLVHDERGADISCVSPREYRNMVISYDQYKDWFEEWGETWNGR